MQNEQKPGSFSPGESHGPTNNQKHRVALATLLPMSISEEIAELRDILRGALKFGQIHDPECLWSVFQERYVHLPPAHNHWKKQPECTCWVDRAARACSETKELK